MNRHLLLLTALLASLAAGAQTETIAEVPATATGMGTAATTGTAAATGTPRQHAAAQAATLLRYGYISYDSVFRAMPEYAETQQSIAMLRSKYDAEMKRSEDEFNAKYEEFLETQRDLVPSILRKRQAELQEMMDKNTAFKAEARRLLAQAEQDAYAPLHARLRAAVGEVAAEQGLAFVLNTDRNACPYINPAMGVDITPLVAARTAK